MEVQTRHVLPRPRLHLRIDTLLRDGHSGKPLSETCKPKQKRLAVRPQQSRVCSNTQHTLLWARDLWQIGNGLLARRRQSAENQAADKPHDREFCDQCETGPPLIQGWFHNSAARRPAQFKLSLFLRWVWTAWPLSSGRRCEGWPVWRCRHTRQSPRTAYTCVRSFRRNCF